MNIAKTLLIVCCLVAVLFSKAQNQFIARNDRPVKAIYSVTNEDEKTVFNISPAAVKKSARVNIEVDHDTWATLEIKDNSGEVVLEQQMAVSKGANSVPIFYVSTLDKGVYNTVLKIEEKVYLSKMVKE